MDTHEEFWLKQIHGSFDPEPKKKKKPEKYPIPQEVKDRYIAAHLEWFKRKFPTTYRDGHYLTPKMPDYQTANGLTNFITNYLDWVGGDGNRINVQGRQVDGKWIRSSTKVGTADIACIHPNSTSFDIEVKVGEDRPSIKQLQRQKKMRGLGKIYEFISTPMEFFELYDRIGAMKLF